MDIPKIEVINIDDTESIATLIDKVNNNFQVLTDFIVKTFSSAEVQKLVAVEGQEYVVTAREFLRNSHTLIVFLNGVVQIQNESYVESSNTTIRFLSPLEEGDEVYLIYQRYIVPATFKNYYTRDEIDALLAEVKK